MLKYFRQNPVAHPCRSRDDLRPEVPADASAPLRSLMQSMWARDHLARPSAKEITPRLEELQRAGAPTIWATFAYLVFAPEAAKPAVAAAESPYQTKLEEDEDDGSSASLSGGSGGIDLGPRDKDNYLLG
jgi:hypothetical protein